MNVLWYLEIIKVVLELLVWIFRQDAIRSAATKRSVDGARDPDLRNRLNRSIRRVR